MMVRALAILLLCQLAGTVIEQATGLPIPGPVLGLVMLLGILVRAGGPPDYLRALRQNAMAISIAIPVSTFLGLAVTGVLMQRFVGRRSADTPADA
jgi:holin-like protein